MPVAAIIPVAGFSSRMNAFKPLLPLGKSTLLEAVINLFKTAGIRDIHAVTGHRADDLEPAIIARGGIHVHNPDYSQGMLSSIKAGIRSLAPDIRAFFVLPADIPSIRPSTVARILDALTVGTPQVLYPVYERLRGHPPLIDAFFASAILDWRGDGGLRGCLETFDRQSRDVPVCDRAIHMDADTPDDYDAVCRQFGQQDLPCLQECYCLLNDVLGVSRDIVLHNEAVAGVARIIARHLNPVVPGLDLERITASAMLHDMMRHLPDHAEEGARSLRALGFHSVADLVQAHMDLVARPDLPVSEHEILFLADKLVLGHQVDPCFISRFDRKLDQWSGQDEAVAAIRQRLESTRIIQNKIEALLGRSICDIVIES